MIRYPVPLIVLLLTVTLAMACSASRPSEVQSSETEVVPTATRIPPHTATRVAAEEKGYERVWITTDTIAGEYAFTPNKFTFTAGDTVRFVLRGVVEPYGYWYHTFTIPKLGYSILVPARSKPVWLTFDEPGVYDFLCLPHPWMKGRITVLPDQDPA